MKHLALKLDFIILCNIILIPSPIAAGYIFASTAQPVDFDQCLYGTVGSFGTQPPSAAIQEK